MATPNIQTPPLLFVDNECAIGLATSSVRPKKSKSINMRLDWLKERASQLFFRLVFLPGLINPADFFTKILSIYRHLAALLFLHGTPYPISLLSELLAASNCYQVQVHV